MTKKNVTFERISLNITSQGVTDVDFRFWFEALKFVIVCWWWWWWYVVDYAEPSTQLGFFY